MATESASLYVGEKAADAAVAKAEGPLSGNIRSRFEQIRSQATILAEAYRLRLVGRLWWANLLLVVLPATCATAAAITAIKQQWVGAALAGAAAVLAAIHKALRCEEYQTECLRLGPAYQRIAIKAESAISHPNPDSLDKLTTEMADLAQSAKALLPTQYIEMAQERTKYKLY